MSIQNTGLMGFASPDVMGIETSYFISSGLARDIFLDWKVVMLIRNVRHEEHALLICGVLLNLIRQ